MRRDQVVFLYFDMESHGVELWLMGGWGVDALLGRQTRDHHDLDVLIEVESLERFRQRLDDLDFAFQFVWDDETWWVSDVSWSGPVPQPTAFVYAHEDGREVDTHVVRREADNSITALWTSPYELTAEALSGRGVVGTRPVRCLTAAMQRRAHTGYELPPHHAADIRLLAEAMPE